MDIDDEENVESFDNMQRIIDEADNIMLDMLPTKSKIKYVAAYEKFVQWRSEQKIEPKNMCEQVMLVYIKHISDKDQLKPPSIWSKYSMLESTLLAYENLNIKPCEKMATFMKKLAKGYCPKKAMTFTADDIANFCATASDEKHLADKVILILGMAGGLRREEIYNIISNDVTEDKNSLLFSIPKTKNGNPKSFVVMGELREIVDRYRKLRPANVTNNKFFINYQK